MADLQKHRDELESFAVTFALDSGEILTGTPTVSVGKRHATIADSWTDVSSEFGITGIALDATTTKVLFKMGVAAGANQAAGDDYAIRVKADTDASRSPVEAPTLEVLATASV